MRDLNNNIKLSYLYRDSCNFKQFGFEIFSNNSKKELIEIENELRNKLIDREFFVANDWNLEPLQNDLNDFEIDHNWHEFESIEQTHEEVTTTVDILQFIRSIGQSASTTPQ
jgi:hypothetical protein